MGDKQAFVDGLRTFLACSEKDADWAFLQLSTDSEAMDNVAGAMASLGCGSLSTISGAGAFAVTSTLLSPVSPWVSTMAGIGAGSATGGNHQDVLLQSGPR